MLGAVLALALTIAFLIQLVGAYQLGRPTRELDRFIAERQRAHIAYFDQEPPASDPESLDPVTPDEAGTR